MNFRWLKIFAGAIFVLIPGFILRDNLRKHPILSIIAICLAFFLFFQTVQSLMVTNDSRLDDLQNRLNQLVKEMEQEREELGSNNSFQFTDADYKDSYQSGSSPQSNIIKGTDWIREPNIVEIRKIYQQIEKLVGEKKLVIQDKSSICYDGSVLVQATIYTDKNTITRKYKILAGTEDSIRESSYYYDEYQTLRFTFSSTKTVHDYHSESRIYFAANGEKIYENERLLREGFGASGPVRNVYNPQEDFNNLCE